MRDAGGVVATLACIGGGSGMACAVHNLCSSNCYSYIHIFIFLLTFDLLIVFLTFYISRNDGAT